jgi:hypothetical protein
MSKWDSVEEPEKLCGICLVRHAVGHPNRYRRYSILFHSIPNESLVDGGFMPPLFYHT